MTERQLDSLSGPSQVTALPRSPASRQRKTAELAQTVSLGSDRAKVEPLRAGRATAGTDPRREKALSMALAMLQPEAPRTAAERWTTPEADPSTQTRRALRLINDLQSPEALPAVLKVIQSGGDQADRAKETFKALLPFADGVMLSRLHTALAATNPADPLADLKVAVDATRTERQSQVAPRQSDHSLTGIHWREAGRGVIDFVEDITVGTVKQAVHDPLHFPTQLIVGVGSSLKHALKDSGGAVMGLVTGGHYGSFGSQMTMELGNVGMWSSGFGKARQKNMHPEFADVQKLTKDGFARDLGSRAQYVKPESVAATWLKAKLGVSESVAGVIGKAEKKAVHGITKLWYGTETVLPGETGHRKGALWKDLGTEPMKADHVLGSSSKELFDFFSNKYNEAHTINTHSPGAMPLTVKGAALLEQLGLKLPLKEADRPAFLQALQTKLDAKFPEGFFVKGVADYNTGGNLPTNKTNFVEMYDGFLKEYAPLEAKLKAAEPLADHQPKLKVNPYQAGRTLDALMKDPDAVIFQEKLPLKRYTKKDVPLGAQPFNEYRLHIVHGKVVPGATSHRWSVLHTLFGRKTLHAAEAWAQKQVDKLPASITHATALCPDVVQLQDGSFRFIEMNAFGNSGFLHLNPLAAHKLVEAVTGTETTPAYLARRVGRSTLAATTVATHQPASPDEPAKP